MTNAKRQPRRRRLGFNEIDVTQFLDEADRAGVSQIRQSFRDERRLDRTLRRRWLLLEGADGRAQFPGEVLGDRLRSRPLVARSGWILRRICAGDHIDGRALTRDAIPVDCSFNRWTLRSDCRRVLAETRDIETLRSRKRSGKRTARDNRVKHPYSGSSAENPG